MEDFTPNHFMEIVTQKLLNVIRDALFMLPVALSAGLFVINEFGPVYSHIGTAFGAINFILISAGIYLHRRDGIESKIKAYTVQLIWSFPILLLSVTLGYVCQITTSTDRLCVFHAVFKNETYSEKIGKCTDFEDGFMALEITSITLFVITELLVKVVPPNVSILVYKAMEKNIVYMLSSFIFSVALILGTSIITSGTIALSVETIITSLYFSMSLVTTMGFLKEINRKWSSWLGKVIITATTIITYTPVFCVMYIITFDTDYTPETYIAKRNMNIVTTNIMCLTMGTLYLIPVTVLYLKFKRRGL